MAKPPLVGPDSGNVVQGFQIAAPIPRSVGITVEALSNALNSGWIMLSDRMPIQNLRSQIASANPQAVECIVFIRPVEIRQKTTEVQ